MSQVVAGLVQGQLIHVEALHEGEVRVVAESTGISDGDEEQIQGCRRMAAGFEVMVTDQTVIHPTELLGDLTDTVWTDGVFL